jgi:hypothetical protein
MFGTPSPKGIPALTGYVLWISRATVTDPVEISSSRSHVGEDLKIGLVTPAINAGLAIHRVSHTQND